jgi:hypothetical protein
MALTVYRDTRYSLTHLIEDIKHGNIALPESVDGRDVWVLAVAAASRPAFEAS